MWRASQMNNNYKYYTLKMVIDRGLQLLQDGVSENAYQVWLQYSRETIEQIAGKSVFHINYLQVILATMDVNIELSQKLSMCLKYLIGILPLIR